MFRSLFPHDNYRQKKSRYRREKRKEKRKKDEDKNWKQTFCLFFVTFIFLSLYLVFFVTDDFFVKPIAEPHRCDLLTDAYSFCCISG